LFPNYILETGGKVGFAWALLMNARFGGSWTGTAREQRDAQMTQEKTVPLGFALIENARLRQAGI
jgi:hypothetical protein